MCCCGVCVSDFDSIPDDVISTVKSTELYTASSQIGFYTKNLASKIVSDSMSASSIFIKQPHLASPIKQDTSQTITINQPQPYSQNEQASKPIVIEIHVKQVEEKGENNATIYKELLDTLEKITEMLVTLHETQAKEISNLTNETIEKQDIINNLKRKIAELDSGKMSNQVETDNNLDESKKINHNPSDNPSLEHSSGDDNLDIIMSTSLEKVLEKMISQNSNISYSKKEMKSLMQQIFSQCTVINAKSSPALHTLINNLSNPQPHQINNEESSRNTLNSEKILDSSSSNPGSSLSEEISEKNIIYTAKETGNNSSWYKNSVTVQNQTAHTKKKRPIKKVVSSTFQNLRYQFNIKATNKWNDKKEPASSQKTITRTLSNKISSIKATLSRKDVSVQCVRDIISKLCLTAISKARNAARQLLLSCSDQDARKPEKVEITMTVPFNQLISGDSMQSVLKISPKVEIAKEVTPVMVSKSIETIFDSYPPALADKNTQVCSRRMKKRALNSLQSSQIIRTTTRRIDQRRFVIRDGQMGGDRLTSSNTGVNLEICTPRVSQDYPNSTQEPIKRRDYVNFIHSDNTHHNKSQLGDSNNYPFPIRNRVNSSTLKRHANSSLDKTICLPVDSQSMIAKGDMACQTFRSLKYTTLDVKNCSDGITIIGSKNSGSYQRKNIQGSDCIIINDVPERDSDVSSNSLESNDSVNY